jgi:hypothetical protein
MNFLLCRYAYTVGHWLNFRPKSERSCQNALAKNMPVPMTFTSNAPQSVHSDLRRDGFETRSKRNECARFQHSQADGSAVGLGARRPLCRKIAHGNLETVDMKMWQH